MLVRQTFFHAAVDKYAELRSLLEDNVRNNSSGLTGGLTRPVFGSLFTFGVSSLFENLEALEKDRDTAEANPQIQEFRAKIGTLIREPVEVTVGEIIVPPASGANERYRELIEIFPALGNGNQVQETLVEFAKSQQAAGRPNFSCGRRLFSNGRIFTLRDTYETLAEQENVSRERSAAFGGLMNQLTPLISRPASIELRELVVSYGG